MSDRNIIVLGGSYAGLSAAHYTLKHIIPTLSEPSSYHVYLVTPSTHFLNRVSGPRAITKINGPGLPESKVLIPIKEKFAQYPKGSFTFVEGVATAVDVNARTITYSSTSTSKHSETASLPYHALIITTGVQTGLSAWSNSGNVQQTQSDLDRLRASLSKAKDVVIGGGGPSGVETAGEVAQLLNGTPSSSWLSYFTSFFGIFGSSGPQSKAAKVTLITNGSKLLPLLRPSLAAQAEAQLRLLGVAIIYETKITNVTQDVIENHDSKTTVTLHNGEEIKTDLYITANGMKPNTSFLPPQLVNDAGKVKNNTSTLRVDAAGPRVYAFGDVGAHTKGGLFNVINAIPVAMTNIKRDLQIFDSTGGLESTPEGEDRLFTEDNSETQIVPVGTIGGVGAVKGWRVPTLLVRLLKGRDMMSWKVMGWVDGGEVAKEAK